MRTNRPQKNVDAVMLRPHVSAMEVGAVKAPTIRRSQIMQAITTNCLDNAKSVFQVHGVDAEGKVALRRQLKRRYVLAFFQKLPRCLVGIEARCEAAQERCR